MRHWTKRILITSALMAFSSPALADGHGDDPTPCESDADCDAYHVCVEGHSDDETTVSVSTSSEGSDEEAADMARLEPCETDEDCGGGAWTCVDDYCTYGDPEEPEEPEDVEEAEEAMMYCAVDLSEIPAAPACATLCDVMAECGGLGEGSTDVSTDSEDGAASSSGFAPDEGEGSGGEDSADPMPDVPEQSCETASDCANEDAECIDGLCSTEWDHSEMEPGESEPIEMSPEALEAATKWCNQVCSYGVYMEVGLDELASLNACIEGADVEAICAEESCGDEGEAWGEALDASGVMDGLESSVGGVSTGAAESGPASGDNMESSTDDSSATGAGAPGDEAATDGGAEEADGDGGCNASDAPLMPWAVVLGLMTVVFMRRREAL
jgi:hypothetical protein